MRYCVLYNPIAGDNANLKERLERALFGGDFYYMSMPEVKDYKQFFAQVKDNIIICGGDGTLNYFINKITSIPHQNHILYFDTGSGNDFHTDVRGGERPYGIDIYIENLPIVRVNGKLQYMLNGCGCGIDSYACYEGEKQRAKDGKPINYVSIVKKGLIHSFKPFRARITVDGMSEMLEDVWLSPVMNGRYFGGGIQIAPMQNRLQNQTLSIIVAHTKSRIAALSMFPMIEKGTHTRNEKIFKVLHGKNIKIEIDRPMPLQIDGEVIPDVTMFEVFATKK